MTCPELPATDPRGLANGRHHRSFLKPTIGRKGLANAAWSPKTQRDHSYLSFGERNVHYWLHFQANVVDIREQYPCFDPDELAAYLDSGRRIPRNKVMTLDFVLTLSPTTNKPLRYVGVSVKENHELESGEDVWERFARERRFCGEHGWAHTIYTEKEVPRDVARRTRRVALWASDSDIASDAANAQRLAELMPHGTSEVSLNALMVRAARKLACTCDDAYRLLSVAGMLGFVNIDFTREVSDRLRVAFE
ncbi:TnsA endonuclease N-terminal domain-containing protein [Burkholderia sp. S-53]|uniref:TnsA endonuclease N-terminal domain-containing protein n=1 Tax=Burkholderia sp. S-53 TaxID=2906514 RepID=UPI0021CFF848|nr:TnsA endonuclease N-terminal domain-containing protein [Burkholderia sp. S-53]UXU92367.1 TnsA endonuclease N-terminal domain-containing protein [Burkholderia sp. S-53]